MNVKKDFIRRPGSHDDEFGSFCFLVSWVPYSNWFPETKKARRLASP
jgi:hypothetical protein